MAPDIPMAIMVLGGRATGVMVDGVIMVIGVLFIVAMVIVVMGEGVIMVLGVLVTKVMGGIADSTFSGQSSILFKSAEL